MISHETDRQFEERVRSMLHEVAERFDPVVPETVVAARRTRRLPLVAASALVIVGLVGIVAVASRPGGGQTSPTDGGPGSSADDVVDRLLYPGRLDPGVEPEVSVVELSGADIALLTSPSDRQHALVVGRIGATVLDTLADRREIAGRTVVAEQDERASYYQWIDQCVLGGVRSDAGDELAWNDEDLALLSAIVVDADDVTLTLPRGWTVVDAGTSNPLIQLVFDVEVGGAVRTVVLGQSIGGSIASVLPGTWGPFTPTDRVPGREAWIADGVRSPVLLFKHDGVAVGVWGNGVGVDDLVTVATELVPRPDEWTRLLADPLDVAPPATPAPGAAPDLCGAPRLTIR